MNASSPDRIRLQVKLDVFDGPLDLLLNLVLQQDLDITKVSLASVCEQYLAYLSVMEGLDLDVASEYLVIAATLVFIKSKTLLPPPPPPFDDALDDEARLAEEALRQRLIAYQYFKNLGARLRTIFESNTAFFARPTQTIEGLVQHYRLDPAALGLAFARAMANAEARPAVVKRETFSMVVKMNFVLRQIRERASALFSELVEGCQRLEVVVTFLAVLELIKARKIVHKQRKPFEDIALAPAPKGETDHLAHSA